MKRILLFAAAVLAVGCSKKSANGVKLKSDLDSVAYVIGMNVVFWSMPPKEKEEDTTP